MKVGFVLLDGLDILSAVKNFRQLVAEIVDKEVTSGNINQDRYSLNLTFNELLNDTWSLEFYSNKGDSENSKRIRIVWYYALNDEHADTRYSEGKLAHKFIAEYYVVYSKEEIENNTNIPKEEEVQENN